MNNEELRSVKVLRNAAWAIVGYTLYALAGFFSRSIFIARLGQEIAGVSSLFNSILSLLSMAELGFGGAISVHLYKPVAEQDHRKIAALLNLYKKAYRIIAASILALGLGMLPFVQHFAKSDQLIPHLRWYFFLYIIQSVCSYCYAYKGVLLSVSQQSYIKSNITNLFLIGCTLGQVCILYWTGSFTLYLLLYIVSTLLSNVAVNWTVNRHYAFLRQYARETLDKAEKRRIFSFIKATSIDRMAGAVKNATDNMIISGFVGVLETGIVGNYTMIINTARTLLNFFFSSATDATGNLAATASKQTQYHTFLDMEFIALWLYGFVSTGMLCTITPFVCGVWLRNDSLGLPFSTLFLLVLNFYLLGITWPAEMFFCVKGLIKKMPFMNVINVVINLVVSLLLVPLLGVNGVFIGTVLSYFLSNFLIMHYLVLQCHFEGNYAPFLRLFIKYALITVAAAACCIAGCYAVDSLLVRIVLCTLIYNGIFLLLSFRSREFRSLFQLAVGIMKPFFAGKTKN